MERLNPHPRDAGVIDAGLLAAHDSLSRVGGLYEIIAVQFLITHKEQIMSKPPTRALTLKLALQADTWQDLISALEEISTSLVIRDAGNVDRCSGGVLSGYTLTVTHDPDRTPGEYVRDLIAWRKARRADTKAIRGGTFDRVIMDETVSAAAIASAPAVPLLPGRLPAELADRVRAGTISGMSVSFAGVAHQEAVLADAAAARAAMLRKGRA